MKYITNTDKYELIIEEDPAVGFYLVVYPLDAKNSIADHLLDDLVAAIEFARKKYGVEKDKWALVS